MRCDDGRQLGGDMARDEFDDLLPCEQPQRVHRERRSPVLVIEHGADLTEKLRQPLLGRDIDLEVSAHTPGLILSDLRVKFPVAVELISSTEIISQASKG